MIPQPARYRRKVARFVADLLEKTHEQLPRWQEMRSGKRSTEPGERGEMVVLSEADWSLADWVPGWLVEKIPD